MFDSQIFKYIKPTENDKLSQFKGTDLLDLFILIDDFYLVLRDRLGFSDAVTFGLELEFEKVKQGINKRIIMERIAKKDWKMDDDSTLDRGAEILSPILKDNVKTWQDLNHVCKVLKEVSEIYNNAGSHIHIGTQTLGEEREHWLNFLKLWSVYENIIFRFSYGEYLTFRPSIEKYAEMISKRFWNTYEEAKQDDLTLYRIINNLNTSRYRTVNFANVDIYNLNETVEMNTIEFRCPNGTLSPVIWQNNVNLFVNLLTYSKSKQFNDDIVQKRRIENLDKYAKLNLYSEIFLEQSLELADEIFSTNLDKIYFLKQYLKSFKNYNEKEEYLKGLILTLN